MSPKTKQLAIGSILAAFGIALMFGGMTSRHGGEGEVFFGVLCLVPAVFFLKKAFASQSPPNDQGP
jgi:hypothetical protein